MTLTHDAILLRDRIRGLEANTETLRKELEFYKATEKGKLRAAYIRLQTFAQLVSDFCGEDSAGHMKYLHHQAEIALQQAKEES